MLLTVNGQSREHAGNGSVASLLDQLGADAERVALMVNGKVITREARPTTTIKDGDNVEILVFAGGG